tara:strand:- start:77 stop:334 length:258 start_codon:yes stop_codon:yes gene_type:complete
MDWKNKIKEIDLSNLSATLIAVFGSISVTGFVQIVYCGLTCISFYLTFRHTIKINQQKQIKAGLENELLQIDVEAKRKKLNEAEK